MGNYDGVLRGAASYSQADSRGSRDATMRLLFYVAPEPEPDPPAEPQARNWNRSPETSANRRRDAYLDPQTGDHVWVFGRQQRAAGAESRVFLALATRRGSFFGAPEMGSRLHELTAEKALPTRRILAVEMAQEALAGQIRDGLLRDVEVLAELDTEVRGRINLHVTATDGLTGRPVTVFYPVG